MNKKRIVICIIIAALVLVYFILSLVTKALVNNLPDQLAADRWVIDGDTRAAQISLFFTEDRQITPNDISKLEYLLEKKMSDAGIVTEEDNDSSGSGSRKIVDTQKLEDKNKKESEAVPATEPEKPFSSCYSAQGISTIVFENKKAENIDTIGVSGDFFLFHPMELVSGAYFGPDDIMKDRIVIDEELAWQLFGSNDVAGQCVTIGGINHYVSGVVKREEGRLNEAAGLSKSMVYMSYESLASYGEILSGKVGSSGSSSTGTSASNSSSSSATSTSESTQVETFGGINCYEVVMPDPVEGLAARLVKESSSLDDRYIVVVDNTLRFSFFSLVNVISGFGVRSMWDKPIFYPYWENVARGWEDILGFICLIRIICIVIALVLLTYMIIYLYRHKTWTVAGIVSFLADKKYEFESRRISMRNSGEQN